MVAPSGRPQRCGKRSSPRESGDFRLNRLDWRPRSTSRRYGGIEYSPAGRANQVPRAIGGLRCLRHSRSGATSRTTMASYLRLSSSSIFIVEPVGSVDASGGRAVITVGHSNHHLDHFIRLVREAELDVVVDVRSHPYSRFAGQFNREPLERSLTDTDVRYLFLGRELGGRPEGDEFYDEEGHVLYGRVARSRLF